MQLNDRSKFLVIPMADIGDAIQHCTWALTHPAELDRHAQAALNSLAAEAHIQGHTYEPKIAEPHTATPKERIAGSISGNTTEA